MREETMKDKSTKITTPQREIWFAGFCFFFWWSWYFFCAGAVFL